MVSGYGFRLAIFYIPFLIGFIISLLIEPLIKRVVDKTNLTRKTAAVLVMLIIFSILIGLITWGIIAVVTETADFLQNSNTYVEHIYNKIEESSGLFHIDSLGLPDQVVGVINVSVNDFLETARKLDFRTFKQCHRYNHINTNGCNICYHHNNFNLLHLCR